MTQKNISITRTFNAPREDVWIAWTDPIKVMQWWGPKEFTSPECDIDLRVGGKYLFCMHGPAGTEFDRDMWSGGEYKDIVPMEKIVMTDHFMDADGNILSPAEYGMPGEWPEEMVITLTFEDAGKGKTKLTILHEGHPADIADMAEQGWNESLDKMEHMLP